MSKVEQLKALLDIDPEGEKVADMINNLIIDDRKRLIFYSKLADIHKQCSVLGQEIKLAKSEEAVRDFVLSENRLLTSQNVADMIDDKYKSLKYKTHASSALNSLVKKGVLGRVKNGFFYYYKTPKEAVIQHLKKMGKTPDVCSPEEISKVSKMPLNTVLDVLEMLQS